MTLTNPSLYLLRSISLDLQLQTFKLGLADSVDNRSGIMGKDSLLSDPSVSSLHHTFDSRLLASDLSG